MALKKIEGQLLMLSNIHLNYGGKHCKNICGQLELLDELGPSSTIRTAFQYNFIDEGEDYMDMLKARNLITHTYKEDTAIDIHNRITKKYPKLFEEFIKKFDNKIL